MDAGTAGLVSRYEEAARRHEEQRRAQRDRARVVAYARIVTFLAGAGFAVLALRGSGSLVSGAASAAFFLAFFVLVYIHSRVDARERWHAVLAQLNVEAAARVGRRWDRLPLVPLEPPPPSHPYAADLDLFGSASLFQLLGAVGSESGRRVLRAWLLEPAAPEVVVSRQQAVKELATRPEFREDLAALGRLVEPGAQDLEAFFSWAEGCGWMLEHGWLPWTVHALRVAILALLTLQLAGAVNGPFWIYPMLAGLGLGALYSRRTVDTYTKVFSRQPLFHQHAEMFRRLEVESFGSLHLRELQARLARSGLTAWRETATLDRLKRLADLRFQALFHFPVNALTLWDLGVIERLERWQRRTGGHLREWFDILGEADALCGIAALSHDNPGWVFPSVTTGEDRLVAEGVGHPILRDDHRVVNDVSVGPAGTLLLVTGSNMSGKSTLLRSIGVNAVLAQAGAPVCASRFTMPPLTVYTSMRVQDSLEAGVSYFMAALQRLKLIVDAARRSPQGSPRLLYLLDEILQGTNTAERQVAVRHILGHLLSLPVIGAVTTHDLELAGSPELAAACEAVHFVEGVEGAGDEARLTFDYKLRPGVATSRNALKLLHLVGLDR